MRRSDRPEHQSELLIKELYIDLRNKINYWAKITKQTAQARMGYIGQHLVSIVTGYPGGRSGARGRDLIISDTDFGEIKTCYRVDQLGSCNSCGTAVASIEDVCPKCGTSDIVRREDSKWLISIRNEDEYSTILEPKFYYLVLFEFEDYEKPDKIISSIWKVDPLCPGFAFCMIDYYNNIRGNAPFNLWPYSLKFDLMCPRLIYRSHILKDDTIQTEVFPGRDDEVPPEFDLNRYRRARNLTVQVLINFAESININIPVSQNRNRLIDAMIPELHNSGLDSECALNTLSRCFYTPNIEDDLEALPVGLRNQMRTAGLI